MEPSPATNLYTERINNQFIWWHRLSEHWFNWSCCFHFIDQYFESLISYSAGLTSHLKMVFNILSCFVIYASPLYQITLDIWDAKEWDVSAKEPLLKSMFLPLFHGLLNCSSSESFPATSKMCSSYLTLALWNTAHGVTWYFLRTPAICSHFPKDHSVPSHSRQSQN